MFISNNGHQKFAHLKEIGICASRFDNHSRLNSQHNWRDLCCLLMAHCHWILITYNNSRLATKLFGIGPGFFRYISRQT